MKTSEHLGNSIISRDKNGVLRRQRIATFQGSHEARRRKLTDEAAQVCNNIFPLLTVKERAEVLVHYEKKAKL